MFKITLRHAILILLAMTIMCGSLLAQQASSHSSFSGRPLPWSQFDGKEAATSEIKSSSSSAEVYATAPAATTSTKYKFPGFLAPLRTGVGDGSGGSTYGVMAADFDGTNGVDVATIQNDGILTVLLNDGKGNLTQSSQNTSGSGANIVQALARDLNGDGLPDIVATSNTLPGFFIWMNQGKGAFADVTKVTVTPPAGITVRDIMGAMALGDVNGDGKTDLVLPLSFVSGSALTGYTTTMVIDSYLGNGDGTFNSSPKSTQYSLSGYYIFQGGRSIALADLSNHGALDAVLQIEQPPPGTTSYFFDIATIKGNGDGTFGPLAFAAQSVASTQYGRGSLVVGDYNNDGSPDVLFADGSSSVDICYGAGDGTLQSAVTAIANVGIVVSLTTGDYNNDGVLDLVTFRGGIAQVYLGTGSGSFQQSPVSQYGGGLGGNQVEDAVDFNNDGNLDFFWTEPFFDSVNVFLGRGDGTFRGATAIAPANTGTTLPNNTQSAVGFQVLTTGDYNGDGSTDIFAEESGYVDIGLSDHKGGFLFTRSLDTQNLTSVDFVEPIRVDLNKDGKADIVMASYTGVRVFLSEGDGTLSSPINTVIPTSLGCELSLGSTGDINGDGLPDLVIAYGGNSSCYASGSSPSGFAVLLGDGKGGFTSSLFTDYGSDLYEAQLADINKDGKLDLILNDISYGKYAVTIIPGNGDGTFNTTSSVVVWSSTSHRVADVQVADTNNDGAPDLMLAYIGSTSSTTNPPGVLNLLGKGDFTFAAPVYVLQGVTGVLGAVTDVNNDGLPDYVLPLSVQDTTVSGVAVLINAGAGAFNDPILYVQPSDVLSDRDKLVFAGDFNGDGAADVIIGGGQGYVPSVLFLNKAGLSLTLGSSATTALQGTSVNLYAEPNLLSTGNLTGDVSFFSNGVAIGTASWSDNVATLNTTDLPLGTNSITATYAGDDTHASASAAAISINITTPPAAFTLTGTPDSVDVARGNSTPVTLTLQSNSGFSGPVVFACSNLPAGATCTFSSETVTLAASSTASVTATITTSTTSASAKSERINPLGMSTGLSVAGLCLLVLPLGMRRKTFPAVLVLLAVMGGVLAMMTGCGGSDSSSKGTPTGTALVTITATGTSGSTQIANAVLVQVNVTKK